MAKLIEHEPPIYPVLAMRYGLEGWVTLSFVIARDGKVGDVVVQNSSGLLEFERAAESAALQWRYEPATWGGEPVEQCQNEVLFSFGFEDGAGARSAFTNDYAKVMRLYDEKLYEEAGAAVEELAVKRGLNLYERAWIWMLRAILARQGPDREGELVALETALIQSNDDYFEPALLRNLLLREFELEASLRRYRDALATLDRLQKLDPNGTLPAPVLEVAGQIAALRESPASFAVSGSVAAPRSQGDPLGVWQHTPLHREIAFDMIEGSIERFELRCSWQRFADTPSPETSWRMPQDWGDCSVFVFAPAGTRFRLIEYGPEPGGES
jgi:TonB family protein